MLCLLMSLTLLSPPFTYSELSPRPCTLSLRQFYERFLFSHNVKAWLHTRRVVAARWQVGKGAEHGGNVALKASPAYPFPRYLLRLAICPQCQRLQVPLSCQ